MSDLTTEVIGFRQWYVTPDLTLRAAHMRKSTWTPGVNEAECHKIEHGPYVDLYGCTRVKACAEAPGHDCECGMYALHSPDDFWYGQGGTMHRGLTGPDPDTLVSGVVVAWGNIEVHHSGFRAQYARIVALAAPAGKRDAAVARAVAAEYGVPLVAAEELPGIAGEFGQVIPESLCPDKPKPEDDMARYMAKIARAIQGQRVSGSGYRRGPSQPSWQSVPAPIYTHGNVGNPFYYTDATVSFDTESVLTSNTPWADAAKEMKEAQKHEAKPPQRKPTARGTGYDPRHFQSKRHGGLA